MGTNIVKTRGPKIEPWGTTDLSFWNVTNCLLFNQNSANTVNIYMKNVMK